MRANKFPHNTSFNGRCVKNWNLVTNFRKEQEPIYKKAIEEYGWDGLYITEEAYYLNGVRDYDAHALRVKTNNIPDLSDFWKIFYRIKENFKLDDQHTR